MGSSAMGEPDRQQRAAADEQGADPVRVVLETPLGCIYVDVDTARAPATATHFLRQVDGGRYNGGRFHRAVTPADQSGDAGAGELIQARPNPNRPGDDGPSPPEPAGQARPAHQEGTVALAGGATADVVIYLGDQLAPGDGVTPFGQVVDGLDVARAIQRAAAEGQVLTPPVAILRAARTGR